MADLDKIVEDLSILTVLEAAELWPELWSVLPACLLPVFACAALGLFCGALVRSSAVVLIFRAPLVESDQS